MVQAAQEIQGCQVCPCHLSLPSDHRPHVLLEDLLDQAGLDSWSQALLGLLPPHCFQVGPWDHLAPAFPPCHPNLVGLRPLEAPACPPYLGCCHPLDLSALVLQSLQKVLERLLVLVCLVDH